MTDADRPEETPPRVTERLPDERVTERLPEEAEPDLPQGRVTERFFEGAVTDRLDFEEAPPGAAEARPAVTGVLHAGELVDDRYRVEEGPLGVPTGEAELYRCEDMETGEAVALKMYHERMSPKTTVLDNLLHMHHPDVVTLRAYGEWAGRFYEVMDYCGGGSLAEFMPFGESLLRDFVRQIVTGLQYLHSQGIIHRDIKPNNLFFRTEAREDLVIGDFGVSSILEMGESVRKTGTATFFTLDYAAPELIDGKEVSPKTDYYALGVTMLHLYSGRSPFAGYDKNTILGCHFRGNVPRPEGITEDFARLINGLLRVRPESRWGYRQVTAWFDGEPVLTDEGLPDREEVFSGHRVPYRSLPAIGTPAEMAARLDEFNVEKDLQRGFISQWAMFFDTNLGERIARLEEEFEDDPALGVFKLRYILDPTQPLIVGDQRVYRLADLADLMDRPDSPYQSDVAGLLYSGSLEVWVSALPVGGVAEELAQRIAALRQRIEKRPLGVFALLYLLDPARPLRLTKFASVRAPEDLEEILKRQPDLTQRVAQYLFGGYFTEWLRTAFPQREADIAFVEDCRTRFDNSRSQGVFALRCHFQPELPLQFGTEKARTPKELAAMIDRSPQNYERGVRMLVDGSIRSWLVATGRLGNPSAFDGIVNDLTISSARKMEAVLHMLDPALPWPTPETDVASLDGGAINADEEKTLEACFFNAGRGHLSGTIMLLPDEDDGETASLAGFTMDEREIHGVAIYARVTIHGRGAPVGARRSARIVAETNGGRVEVPIRFRVKAPLVQMLARTAAVGGAAAVACGLFRFTLQAAMPAYSYHLMQWVNLQYGEAHARQWGVIPVALGITTVLVGGAYYLYRMYRLRQ